MSQICYLGPSFHFIWREKKGGGGTFSVFSKHFFSRFYGTKTRTNKKNLRHYSIRPDINSMSVKSLNNINKL